MGVKWQRKFTVDGERERCKVRGVGEKQARNREQLRRQAKKVGTVDGFSLKIVNISAKSVNKSFFARILC
jgi:hypothetical protein